MEKCQTLFLELGVDRSIKVDELPDSVEKLLISHAKSLGQKIESLETEDSRFAASQAVKEEMDDLEIEKSFIASRALLEASQCLEAINDPLEIELSIEKTLSFLLKGSECLIEAIKYADWSGSSSEITKAIVQVADVYQMRLENCIPDLGTAIRGLVAGKQSRKFQCKMGERVLLAIQLSWAKGNQECDTLLEKYEEYNGENHPKFKSCKKKEMVLRDSFMLKTILKGLEGASKKQRNFYAK